MAGNTPKTRWIGLGAVGALAVAGAVVAISATGQRHDTGLTLTAGSSAGRTSDHAATGTSTGSSTAVRQNGTATSATGGTATAPQAAAQTVHYVGVWAPGSGAQYWRTNMSVKGFSTWNATYMKKGLRVQDLRVSSDGRGLTAVWRPGKGTEMVRTGLTPSGFLAANASYAKHGLGVTSLDTGHGITAVWRPSGKQTITVGLNIGDFAKRLSAEAKKSMLPVLVDHYTAGGTTRWIGVFQHGTGAWQVRTTTSSTVFHNDVVGYGKNGLRLVGLGSTPYTGVWRPGTGAWQVRIAPLSTFQADTVNYYKQGLRLVRIGRWTS